MNGNTKRAYQEAARKQGIGSNYRNGSAPVRIDRDQLAKYMVDSLASEISGVQIGDTTPPFRFSAEQALANMDGKVAVEVGERFKTTVFNAIPHPGIIFGGIVTVKNRAVEAANLLISSGFLKERLEEYGVERRRVMVAQVLLDHFHNLKEVVDKKRTPGDNRRRLAPDKVAEFLVVEGALTRARDAEFPVDGYGVSEYFPVSVKMLEANMSPTGGGVRVKAFGGVLDVEYVVPPNGQIFYAVCDIKRDAESEAEAMSGSMADEAALKIQSAAAVIDMLHNMELPKDEPVVPAANSGNSASKDADQAEYERIASEENERRNGAPIADSAPEPAPAPPTANQDAGQSGVDEETLAAQMAVSREIKANAEKPPAPGTTQKKARKPRKAKATA